MDDYVRCAGRLRAVVAPHVRALLDAGLTVVLTFPPTRGAPCIAARAGGGPRAPAAFPGCAGRGLRARLRARNESGLHPYTTSEEQYDAITSYFAPRTMKASWCSDTAGRRSAGRAAGVQDSGHFRTLATDSASPVWPGSVRRPRGGRATSAPRPVPRLPAPAWYAGRCSARRSGRAWWWTARRPAARPWRARSGAHARRCVPAAGCRARCPCRALLRH